VTIISALFSPTLFTLLDGVMSEMWSLVRTLVIIMVLLGLFSSSVVTKIRTGGERSAMDDVCGAFSQRSCW